MTPNERWQLLKAELDGREFRSVTATMSAARGQHGHDTTNERRASGNGSRCRKLLKSGKMTGILPAGIWWLLIKFFIERMIHRYLFAS
jgi:hypothetical protein